MLAHLNQPIAVLIKMCLAPCILLLAGCVDDRVVNVDVSDGLVTTSVDTFLAGLRQVNAEHELMIVVRSTTVPPLDRLSFETEFLPGTVSLLPLASDTAAVRRPAGGGFAEAGDGDIDAVLELLWAHGVQAPSAPRVSPVIIATLPQDLEKLNLVISALSEHPNLDVIEANQGRAFLPDG